VTPKNVFFRRHSKCAGKQKQTRRHSKFQSGTIRGLSSSSHLLQKVSCNHRHLDGASRVAPLLESTYIYLLCRMNNQVNLPHHLDLELSSM
jgi:hypothetical protein